MLIPEKSQKKKRSIKKTMIKNYKHQQGHSNYCTVIYCLLMYATDMKNNELVTSFQKTFFESEWVSEWVIDWLIDWLSEWVSEWVGGWVSEWASERVSEPVRKGVIEWVSDCSWCLILGFCRIEVYSFL